MFTDKVQISVQAGSGGGGCNSYYMRTDRKSVAHGGDGGPGGSVIFRADKNAPGLESFRPHQYIAAPPGGNGSSEKKKGRGGEDVVVLVPPGTKIVDLERQLLIRHLPRHGDQVVVVEGGEGGQGNIGGKQSCPGKPGPRLEIELSRSIPADIFFIGLPNSGKSALMNKLTRVHLKEETYPFSTRSPEIGIWKPSDYESLALCEMPSLYESSHEGKGLGADFLKHLEHAAFLVYVVDPVSQFAESASEGYSILRKQLERYSEDLLEIPHVIAVNKMDLPEAQEKMKKKKWKPKAEVLHLSALSGEGMDALIKLLKKKLKEKENA